MGGKTRSGLAVARPGPTAPLVVGEGEGRDRVPCLGSLTPNRRNRCPLAPSRGPLQASGGRASRGGRGGASSSSVRTVGAGRSAAASLPGQRAGGARRACVRRGGRALPAPFPSEFAAPLPPRRSAATSEPPPQPARSPRGRWPVGPVHWLTPSPQFRPASAELRYKLRSRELGFHIPAPALRLPPKPEALPANSRAARQLSVAGAVPPSLCPGSLGLTRPHFTDGELKVDPLGPLEPSPKRSTTTAVLEGSLDFAHFKLLHHQPLPSWDPVVPCSQQPS